MRLRTFTIGVITAALAVSAVTPVAATNHTDPTLAWAHGIGGTNSDQGWAIAVDGSGNTYVTGYFQGTGVDLNPGGEPHLLSSNLGSADIFVAKYDTIGDVLWAHSIGGTTPNDVGTGIAVDGSGNTYVTGYFQGDGVDFNPGGDTAHPLTSNGNGDVFVAKYTTNGLLQWAHNIGGIGNDFGFGIAVDSSSNAYLTGSFSAGSAVNFNPAGDDPYLLTSNGSGDVFVAKYDGTDGELIWAHNIGGNSSDQGEAIAVDGSGNTYITGYFQGNNVDFDPGEATTSLLSSNGVHDIFVAKYDTDGNLQWAHNIGGTEFDVGYGVAVDGAGNTYLTGFFRGAGVDFNPGGTPHLLTSNGEHDVFVAKYDTDGTVIWAHNIGGIGWDTGKGIAVDGSGNTYVTGGFQGDGVDFNPGGTAHLLTSNGGNDDIFVARYDANGKLIWAHSIGETGLDLGMGIAVDAPGNTYLTGFFRGADVDFSPGGTPYLLDSNGGSTDIFVLTLEQAPEPPPDPEPGPDPGVFRLSGANRYDTAAAVAAHHHPGGASAVFVATGTNFPDALAGAVAAAASGSPLLLVSSIPPATATELQRLDPTDIVVLGGEAVVDAATATGLAAYGDVTRLSGPNRYDTAIAISQWAYPTNGSADAVVIATGQNFPDALAAASLAAQVNGPVLLTPTGSLPAFVAAEIERLGPTTIYIIGGTAAVSTAVANQLATIAPTTRLSGANRYDTAIAISQEAFPAGAEIVYVAVGTNFPDALAGAAQAAAAGAPVLLTPTNSLPASVAAEITRLGPVQIIILGGTTVISPTVANQLAALLP